jgi:hypothetical protein
VTVRAATIALLLFLPATSWAQASDAAATTSATVQSSSEKVRDNPAAQYVLIETVVGKTGGAIDGRARPVEPEGYNLLKYCWTTGNVLGDWADRAGLTGEMVVRALETQAWTRDLARAGYPAGPLSEAIGRYEAALVTAGFTDTARGHALDALVSDLDGIRRTTPGTAKIHAVRRCEQEHRSLGLNYTVVPEDGRARFIPFLLYQICQAQQLDPDDPVRCDYWLDGRTDRPMSFAGETVYGVRWPDGSTAGGRFDPEPLRSAGGVTLRPHAAPPK